MGQTVVVHSFYGRVGKSVIIKNLSKVFSDKGKKVAVVDCDFFSPSLDILQIVAKLMMSFMKLIKKKDILYQQD